MSFVGNADKSFENIKMHKPMNSKELSDFLRSQDIFIFASKREACSNCLLEALHCGLPSLTRDCSSNSEILNNNGLLFNDENVLDRLDELTKYLSNFKMNKNIEPAECIYDQYAAFFKKIKLRKKIKTINNKNLIKLQLKLGII